MQGLAVVDGDLVLSGGSFLTLTGVARVRQDLTFALTDEYGADPLHPYWGSILDRFIGQTYSPTIRQQVVAEVQRVLTNYIAVQADQVNTSVTNGVRSSLDTSDVVQKITSIDVQVDRDKIYVKVELETMARQALTVSRTVTA